MTSCLYVVIYLDIHLQLDVDVICKYFAVAESVDEGHVLVQVVILSVPLKLRSSAGKPKRRAGRTGAEEATGADLRRADEKADVLSRLPSQQA